MANTNMLSKNPELEVLSFLIGKWEVEMKHSAIPQPLTWQDTIDWLEDSFIIWHWQGKNEVPQATLIIGRNENESGNMYTMLYYDARKISRTMEMSFENGIWKFWRINSDFSQRFEGRVDESGDVISGQGDASGDGGKTWTHDYSITYKKIK